MQGVLDVSLTKTDDRISVAIRQPYHPRGRKKVAYRWRYAGYFSLKELRRKEKVG